VIVTAAVPATPPPLIEQLVIGGRIVIPVGTRWSRQLIVATRTAEAIERELLGDCRCRLAHRPARVQALTTHIF
jgi:protein-L-isoaspartate(D-aspartate) O-methyltransferase